MSVREVLKAKDQRGFVGEIEKVKQNLDFITAFGMFYITVEGVIVTYFHHDAMVDALGGAHMLQYEMHKYMDNLNDARHEFDGDGEDDDDAGSED